ncbi:cytochrome P450 family protein [Tengunoibacter tsumagoiensis]|uniref:Cytochrome P450 n=1 Tax=Tengunoibacter tsumagoiensis TaxID=2014871 RepID=A0A402AA77_9CHLR|nr:cytochrome P450 [Tengunoibacter tsumagoiensis]GCE15811.1 cytochrome P450 [Tengunoibacter tsumagoiensis]
MSQSTDLDLTSSRFKANPFSAFARLRTENPIYELSSSNGQRTWLVSRYRDVETVLRDDRFIKEQQTLLSHEERAHPTTASADDLFSLGLGKFDPPNHTRLRTLVNPFFTPRQIELWRDRIQEITDALIDGLVERGSMDLLEDLAFPLPLTVILEMLGMPAEDNVQLHSWTKQIVDALDDPAAFEQVGAQLEAYHAYLWALVQRKRENPAQDMITQLLQPDAQGDRLSDRELVAMIFLLIMAGYQTTGCLIGNGMLALLTHPEQMALLQQDPTLIKSAIEEFLRFRSPLMLGTYSWAREDIEWGGQLIRRGDLVLVALAAANRDETEFENPDTLDITRTENRHLAFSKGVHYCLGAPLARLEGQIAISTLLRRLPQMRLQTPAEDLVWRPGAMILGVHHLPVVF